MTRRKGTLPVRPISQADAYDREEREREAAEPIKPVRLEPTQGCMFCWDLTTCGRNGSKPCPVCGVVPKLWKGHFS